MLSTISSLARLKRDGEREGCDRLDAIERHHARIFAQITTTAAASSCCISSSLHRRQETIRRVLQTLQQLLLKQLLLLLLSLMLHLLLLLLLLLSLANEHRLADHLKVAEGVRLSLQNGLGQVLVQLSVVRVEVGPDPVEDPLGHVAEDDAVADDP